MADGLADEAELHFQLGRELYKKGEYALSLEHFLASNRLVPNRNVMFNVALTYEELGRFADAHRYYVDARNGETEPQIIADIDEAIKRIAPHVAVLRIETSPPGATIYIDRKDLGSRGRSPRPLAMPGGRYRVLADLDGFEPAAAEGIEAKIGRETAVMIALRRIVGTVRVHVKGAPSAAVHVDDERARPACVAPCDLDLPPGRHLLYFSREGFQAAPGQVNVTARETVQTTAVLSPLTGSVVVRADERDALIEIDGRPVGFTPAVLQDIAVGRRRVRVSLRGFAPIERDIEVKSNEQTQLVDIQLTPVRQVAAASRLVESIDDAPASITIIDAQELRAFGYPTIGEAIRGVRGVYISNDRAYLSAGIRGLGEPNDYGNRLLVLSDGHSLNDNVIYTSFIGSDARVDLHDIDHIEVVRGPGSLLYGTGALSGIINLVPRVRDAPEGAHAGAGIYENAVGRARAGVHHRFGRDAGAWLSVSGARSGGVDVPVEFKDPGSRPQVANQVEAFESGGTAGRAWYGPLTAQWLFHTRRQTVPTGVFGSDFNDPDTSYEDTRLMAEVRFEKPVSRTVELMARAHANRYVFHGRYEFGDVTSTEDDSGSWFGAEVRTLWSPLRSLRITGGAEAQGHPDASIQVEYPGARTDIHEPYTFGAAYAILDAFITDRLRASAGARLDVFSTFGPIAVPRVALIIKPTAGGTLKLLGGRAFRAPSVFEQFIIDPEQAPAVDPARGLSLEPESILSGEIEYSQRFEQDWVALAAVHASQLDDIIITGPDAPGSDLSRYQNSDSPALTVGGDLELRREWRHGWMLSTSYGYQRARYLDSASSNPRLLNAPEHLASFRSVIPAVPELASIGLRVSLEAPRRLSLESDELTDGAVIADLALSGEIRRFHTRYVIGLYNLMDARYDLPVTETFLARSSRQNGRTLLVDILVTVP